MADVWKYVFSICLILLLYVTLCYGFSGGIMAVNNSVGYSTRIPKLMEELKTKTLTEAERDRNLTQLDYTGVGYGYNLKSHYPKNLGQAVKDTSTPELKRLEKLIAAMG